MSCCDNKKDGCKQGRQCEIHDQLAKQRVDRFYEWLISNYLIVSNAVAIAGSAFVAYIWLTK